MGFSMASQNDWLILVHVEKSATKIRNNKIRPAFTIPPRS
jgi:hypothetical protein